jgi:cell division protein YceG involved in septum cleavage
LFPDTYFVPVKNFTPKKFLERMLRNFQKKVLTDEFKKEYKRQ